MPFARNIRKRERSCSTLDDNYEDRLLPDDDPFEIEYQFLKVLQNKFTMAYIYKKNIFSQKTVASKKKEYESNLKINRDGREKLKIYKERVEHLEKLDQMRNNQQTPSNIQQI